MSAFPFIVMLGCGLRGCALLPSGAGFIAGVFGTTSATGRLTIAVLLHRISWGYLIAGGMSEWSCRWKRQQANASTRDKLPRLILLGIGQGVFCFTLYSKEEAEHFTRYSNQFSSTKDIFCNSASIGKMSANHEEKRLWRPAVRFSCCHG